MNIAHWEFDYVERLGHQVGLIVDGRAWTNREIHDCACRLAHALIELGLNPGDRVAIALPNCLELFIATSATWIAGGVVVVTAEPPERELEAMMNHCEPRVLVTRTRRPPGFGGAKHQVAFGESGSPDEGVPSLERLIRSHEPWCTPVACGGAAVAQLCYTSGVTGLPKAAVYTHGGTEAFWRAMASAADRTAVGTAVLAIPATAFGARFIGMRVATNTRYILLTDNKPASLLEAIEKHGASEISLVPTIAEQLAAYQPARPYDTSSLRAVNLGGSHVSRQLIRQLKARLGQTREASVPGLSVRVHYGMTETGGGIASTGEGGDGLVGKVARGVEVRVVDAQGKDVATSGTGEIIVRSPFAASGYWNDEKNTKEVFRNGFVHTGDLGKLDEQGNLHVLGRMKDVIIQGGYNVSPNDVIGALSGLEGVAGCAVVGMPNDLLGEQIVACIVPAVGSRLDEAAVRAHCRKVLDPRKHPARILFFDELPGTHNGKLDVRAVREHIAAKDGARAASALRARLDALAPDRRVASIAETVEALLAEVLGQDGGAMPVDVPFGELGLDSIGVVRMSHALGDRLGVSISPTLFYSSPTVTALANRIHVKVWGREAAGSGTRAPVETAGMASGAVAIAGIGCRLPGGASSAVQLWDMLMKGVDASCEAPPGRGLRSRGAFLPDVERFDGSFFRLASHAHDIDPRHRMVLEVAWEALEDAGYDPLRLDARRTGVFLGMYGIRYRSRDRLATSPAMGAAYLCQFLNLRGPVMTVDTTCSSSLVAVHAAVTSLKSGECDVAIVGGANLFADGADLNALGVIARDGRSKAFDAGADGFGPGEGCVLLVLRRLSDAQADGDRIHAVIAGTAINHDGRSASLTAPNAYAQEEVIRSALAAAGMEPSAVQYVEAHGTGTLLGDPIEVEGLARVFGDRTGAPLRIGSLKTNVGHLEAAAGVAGLAKAALAIANRRLPPSLHLHSPNPHIPWAQIPIRVQTQASVWPEPASRLVAGVSSFGMSGTNAHAVLCEAPAVEADRWREADRLASCEGPWVLPISAASSESLRALASVWAQQLSGMPEDVACRDVACSASCGRAALSHRLAVVGSTREAWIAGIREYLARGASPLMGHVEQARPALVMVFGGQGPQWWGMGRELLQREPVFREALERCAGLIDRHVPWRTLEELAKDEASSRLDDTRFAQPLLFALQVGVLELWRSWGVEPASVVGHSLGEIAAACAAGVLTLEQAAHVVCVRARLMGEMMGQGRMVAVALSADEAEEHCRRYAGALDVAAVNGPRAVVLSGESNALEALTSSLVAQGVSCQWLTGGVPFHSRKLDGVAGQLALALESLTPRPGRIPLVSSVTGKSAPMMDGAYWGRQCRVPVRFNEAVSELLRNGASLFLEVGPHPVLSGAIQSIAGEAGCNDIPLVASLRRGVPDHEAMAKALAQLYCAGYPVDWSRRYQVRGRKVPLPQYQWDHDVAPVPGDVPAHRCVEEVRPVARQPATRASVRELIRERIAAERQSSVDLVDEHRPLDSLGLDSLAILRLRADIASHLGIEVPAAAVRPDATPAELVAQLSLQSAEASQGLSKDASPLVWLRPSGGGPTWVWIHPVGGGVDCYRAIVRHLPCRSVAIRSPALTDESFSPRSIGQISEHYVRVLDEGGISGPCVLAGWSLGGIIALDMAVRLQVRGTPPVELVLIDTYPPGASLSEALGVFGAGDDKVLMQTFMKDFVLRTNTTRLVSAPAQDAPSPLPGVPAEEAARLLRAFRASIEAARGYQPRTYNGRTLLIRAKSSEFLKSADSIAPWTSVLPELQVQELEGDHYSLLKEGGAARLAAALKACMQPVSPRRVAASPFL
jgi:acyl transferase domain-containing protein/acyl-CoA synthetase (AMP-forming)/AMP-acid ligase II/thioesterase domain-containing protein